MNIAYYDMAIDEAADLFRNIRDCLPALNLIAKPAAHLISVLGLKAKAQAQPLNTIRTAPQRMVVKLHGPEIVFRHDGGFTETGRVLVGTGIHLDGGWHIACLSPEGRHAHIVPTHWEALPKARAA